MFDDNFQVYGARKIWRQLKREGLSIPAHAILLPCSRPSRNGLETPSQAAPTACRPSLTAAPLGGQRKVQAGTER